MFLKYNIFSLLKKGFRSRMKMSLRAVVWRPFVQGISS